MASWNGAKRTDAMMSAAASIVMLFCWCFVRVVRMDFHEFLRMGWRPWFWVVVVDLVITGSMISIRSWSSSLLLSRDPSTGTPTRNGEKCVFELRVRGFVIGPRP